MWSWAGTLGARVPRAAAVPSHTHTLRLAHTWQAQRRLPRLQPPAPERLKPLSPTYYTAKPSYMDTLHMIDQLTREVKRELEKACILAPNAPPPASSGKPITWMSRDRLGSRLGLTLRASQHRSVTSRLSLLHRYKKVAADAFLGTSPLAAGASTHQRDLVHQIIEVLDSYADVRSTDADDGASTFVHTGTPSRGLIDERGVAYARGRRKVSHARVWLVRAQPASLGEMLVNNAPLHQYFSRTAHREIVTWPLRLAGVLGMYNIFAIVRGGGASGQAGALAHGVANALVAALGTAEGENATNIQLHVQHLLAQDGVLIRDPRMVERKKPGLAKARKAYTWVKR
ncbi:37S ribosomal protein S9, mitochondrial [Malassezia arunalokei]|uniref:Small ribosomal subunit protein uS9m n=1 Tax=Malassezia arunalokei TaxID=1514897 RepID=A0AAJ6CJX4_9BASI|nr:37S ribosomal protein S9, mitochondrial [Malassezia arunalokei]